MSHLPNNSLAKSTLDEIQRVVNGTIHKDPTRGFRAGELFKELSEQSRQDLGKVTRLCRVLEAHDEEWDLDCVQVRMPPQGNGKPKSDRMSVYFSLNDAPPGKVATCS